MASKYGVIIVVQLLIIFADILFNSASTVLFNDATVQLLLYILQDTLIVMSLIVMIISFSSSFVFQAGLIAVLLRKFAVSLFFSIFYLILSVVLHVMSVKSRWGHEDNYIWSDYLTAVYCLQRVVAVPYYWFYKRTFFMLSNPKYHSENSEWLRIQLRARSKPPYNLGAFRIQINFPAEFPFAPPKFQFLTKIFHPSVDESGKLGMLGLKSGNWMPAMRMNQVLMKVANLIENVEYDQPLRHDLVELLNHDESTFHQKAAEFTKSFAEKRS
ncbi:hypothetical protein M3Y98_00546800 [Aphelenchoides besseyi]|nr:hypothetical protein M3Y98_00546800 [Aphelenchoides besseyi]